MTYDKSYYYGMDNNIVENILTFSLQNDVNLHHIFS